MPFFTSPQSSINLPPLPHPSPAYASVAMSRSDSRDSNTSNTSSVFATAYYSTSPSDTYAINSRPQSSSGVPHSSTAMRRTSSSSSSSSQVQMNSWLPSPYKSCQMRSMSSFSAEASSYISDDDLLSCGSPSQEDYFSSPPTSTITTCGAPTSFPAQFAQQQRKKELTTEEQIAIIRAQRESEQQQLTRHRPTQTQTQALQQKRVVRFAGETSERRPSQVAVRRPSGTAVVSRRSAAVRRSMAQCN